jgi:hypothetical protein
MSGLEPDTASNPTRPVGYALIEKVASDRSPSGDAKSQCSSGERTMSASWVPHVSVLAQETDQPPMLPDAVNSCRHSRECLQ